MEPRRGSFSWPISFVPSPAANHSYTQISLVGPQRLRLLSRYKYKSAGRRSVQERSYRIPEWLVPVLQKVDVSSSEWCCSIDLVPKKDAEILYWIQIFKFHVWLWSVLHAWNRWSVRKNILDLNTSALWTKGYRQLASAPEVRELTAFEGMYPFSYIIGLQGAPATFQWLNCWAICPNFQ